MSPLLFLKPKTLARARNLDVASGEDYSLGAKILDVFCVRALDFGAPIRNSVFIPDEPEEVTNHVLRQEFITQTLSQDKKSVKGAFFHQEKIVRTAIN
eukprot:TRINITY_DN2312_c0_g1_i1.p1 TRINITY_DN2312_c0_g1~~TRINITY_DN2312_c0_g1_i1.p1  ORF type:complete len:98 (-),score=12.33 TRINITY_DN2312_c0_g1_i1:239-532(-)